MRNCIPQTLFAVIFSIQLALLFPRFTFSSNSNTLPFHGLQFDSVYNNQIKNLQTFQDSMGFIWSCGLGGLTRWDGRTLTYYSQDSIQLSNSNIYKTVIDKEVHHHFWIATQGGLNKVDLKTETVTVYKHSPKEPESLSDSAIQDIVQDSTQSHILWVATVNGLNRFDKRTGQSLRYLNKPGDENSLIYNRLWRLLDDVDNPDILWIIPFKGGFQRFNKKTESFTLYSPDPEIFHGTVPENIVMSSIIQDKQDRTLLWIGTTQHGLFQFNKQTGKFITHIPAKQSGKTSLRPGPILFLYDDGNENIWIGGMVENNGLTLYNKASGTFQNYTHTTMDDTSLADNSVSHVFTDNSGITWISSFNGNVSKIDPHSQQLKILGNIPQKSNSLPGGSVTMMHLSNNGTIWIATEKGLSRYNPKSDTFHNFTKSKNGSYALDNKVITGLYEDDMGDIWISTLLGPLLCFDQQSGTVKDLIFPGIESLMSITEDPSSPDTFWLGTRMGGIARFDKKSRKLTSYMPNSTSPEKGPSMEFVDSLFHDRDNTHLWFGSWHGGGLNRLNKHTEQFTHYLHDPQDVESLSSNAISTIFQDSNGDIWAGTQGGGLNKFLPKTGSFKRYGADHSLPLYIESILEDFNNNLWLSTNRGIFIFNPTTENVEKAPIPMKEGPYQFLPHLAFATDDGTMWFATRQKVVSFNPDKLTTNRLAPPVIFTSFTQGGVPIQLNQKPEFTTDISLGWDNNFFEFEFVALNYTHPEMNQYQYMVEGIDKNWFYAGNRNFGRYSNLPDGRYVLRIKGSNNDGIWSDGEQSIVLSITPPFWRTNWFLLIIVSVSCLLIIFILFYFNKLQNEILSRRKAEKTAHENETQLRTVIDTIPDLVWLKDPAGIYLACNRKFERLFGAKESAIIGKTDYDFFPPEKASVLRKKDLAAIQEGKPCINEEEVIFADDGHTELLETIKTPMHDGEGHLIGVLAIARDISKLRQKEIEIMREKDFTETALNTQRDTFFLFEIRTGKAVRWNTAFNEVSGYTDDEITRLKAPDSYFTEDEVEKANLFIKKVLITGSGTIELDLQCKDGRKIPTEYNVSTIADKDGSAKYLLSIGRDLTSRRLLELRFHQLAQSSSDWIWEVNENIQYTYCSPGVAPLLGFTPEELLGKSPFDLIPSPEKERMTKAFFTSEFRRKPFTNLENINEHKNGGLVILESSGSPIFSPDGDFKGYRGINRDITDRKRMEEELRQSHKMESIGTLAGGIAHDFNNILSIIIGNTELASFDIPQNNSGYKNLQEIRRASLRAKDLVRQLLSFSRKSEQKQVPLDVTEIVKESLSLIRASIPSHIEIVEDISPDIHIIQADATQIHQVILNLCTNAAHAMNENGGLLKLSLKNVTIGSSRDGKKRKKLPYDQYVELTIEDTGTGIAPEISDKIFDPYFTTKEIGRGTGMGLAVVHGIIKNHRGEIRVDSQAGKGSTFTILFPIISSQPEKILQTQQARIHAAKREKILFVDDEKAITDMAFRLLQKLEYDVETTTSPTDALTIISQKPDHFDLVITDMTMPQMNGLILVKQIKKLNSRIPVIVCSGHSSLLDNVEAEEAGIAAIATKPITMAEIGKLIQEALGHQDQQ